MSQDLTQQWLDEIKALKQQLVQLQQDKDAAWTSAEKWRQLYNTESEQRRTDAQMAQQAITSLKMEIQRLQGIDEPALSDPSTTDVIQQQVAQLSSVEELQAKLVSFIKERDRLQLALKTEQENHATTRNSLTTALGDAIDSLTRERTVSS
jgi:hypothetical protein